MVPSNHTSFNAINACRQKRHQWVFEPNFCCKRLWVGQLRPSGDFEFFCYVFSPLPTDEKQEHRRSKRCHLQNKVRQKKFPTLPIVAGPYFMFLSFGLKLRNNWSDQQRCTKSKRITVWKSRECKVTVKEVPFEGICLICTPWQRFNHAISYPKIAIKHSCVPGNAVYIILQDGSELHGIPMML